MMHQVTFNRDLHSQITTVYAPSPGIFEMDELGLIKNDTKFDRPSLGHLGKYINTERPTAEFGQSSERLSLTPTRSISGAKTPTNAGKGIGGNCVSLIEKEVQRIREDTLKRQSRQAGEQAVKLGGLKNDSQSRASNPSPLIQQNLNKLQQQQRAGLNRNSKIAQSVQSLHATLSQGLQRREPLPAQDEIEGMCDTRIKRMKNLLQEAKRKIIPQSVILDSARSNLNSNREKKQPSPKQRKINEDDAELLKQWRTDIEVVRDSLQKLQDDKRLLIQAPSQKPVQTLSDDGGQQTPIAVVSAHLMHDRTPLSARSRITSHDEGQSHGVVTDSRIKKLRFDTDEVYLQYLGKADDQILNVASVPQSRQQSSLMTEKYSTAPPNLTSDSTPPPKFIEEPAYSPSQRKRDESIQRRVKEARVNLEWKIALKLQQRFNTNSQTGMPSSDVEDRPKTTQIQSVNQQQKIVLPAKRFVKAVNLTNQSSATSGDVSQKNHHSDLPFSAESGTGRPSIENNSGLHTPWKQRQSVQSSSGQGIKQRSFLTQTPGSPAPDNEIEGISSNKKAARPIKVVYRIQRATNTLSTERKIADAGDTQTTVQSPPRKISIAKKIKPPTGPQTSTHKRERLKSPPQERQALTSRRNTSQGPQGSISQTTTTSPRRVFSQQRKAPVPQQQQQQSTLLANRKPLIVVSYSQGHSRNGSNGAQPSKKPITIKSFNRVTPSSERMSSQMSQNGQQQQKKIVIQSLRNRIQSPSQGRQSIAPQAVPDEEWLKQCDERVMKFITTSPSKSLKTKLGISTNVGSRSSSQVQGRDSIISAQVGLQLQKIE